MGAVIMFIALVVMLLVLYYAVRLRHHPGE
jgi:hypothetical protein